mmetsp:Transcript_77776/g.166761  ORF Transcript_77776/g.166761 Transcript_77776/m.166761 type:complete len:201 (-) Transcript_77776:213-815(-)
MRFFTWQPVIMRATRIPISPRYMGSATALMRVSSPSRSKMIPISEKNALHASIAIQKPSQQNWQQSIPLLRFVTASYVQMKAPHTTHALAVTNVHPPKRRVAIAHPLQISPPSMIPMRFFPLGPGGSTQLVYDSGVPSTHPKGPDLRSLTRPIQQSPVKHSSAAASFCAFVAKVANWPSGAMLVQALLAYSKSTVVSYSR